MTISHSNLRLLKIAGMFGVFTGATGLTMHTILQRRFKNEVWVQNCVHLLKMHKPANYLLGSPIKHFNVDLGDNENNYKLKDKICYRMPITGPKGHGFYYIKAEQNKEGKLEGTRCEVEIEATTELDEEKFRNKRLLIFDKERHGKSISFEILLSDSENEVKTEKGIN